MGGFFFWVGESLETRRGREGGRGGLQGAARGLTMRMYTM